MTLFSKENIFRFFLFAFIFAIPIAQDVSIKLIIGLIIASLVLVRNTKWRNELIVNSWDLFLYFVILAIGLIYTEDLNSGMGVLEKNLSFLIIPLVFSRIGFVDKKFTNAICGVFTAGVLVASAICLGHVIYLKLTHYPGGFYYEEFTSIIDSHPTYMAYYVCFSIIFLLHLISYEKPTKLQRLILILAILFLSCVLVFTASRSTFISLLMMSSFFFLKLLLEPYPIQRKIQGISVTILLLAVILLQSPFTHRIFPEFLKGRLVPLEKMKGDTWERVILWESALKASPNIVLGVGTGDHTYVINTYYRQHQMPEFADANFNAHNQFIQILFSNGLPGLLALIIILMRPIFLCVSRQNIFGMLTFFPFLIYGISEVFLGRYQGIIFFVLLHQLFIKYLNRNSELVTTNVSKVQ